MFNSLIYSTVMYKNSCGFVCENFPQENQMLQTLNDLRLSTEPQFFYTVLYTVIFSLIQSYKFFQFLILFFQTLFLFHHYFHHNLPK